MRERVRFEREIQDLQLRAEPVYKDYQVAFDASNAADQLKPIFLEKFSFKKKGAKIFTPYGAKVGQNVQLEMVADKDWKAAWTAEAQKRGDRLEKAVLKLAPELIHNQLIPYYKVLGQPLPDRLRVIDETTQLTGEERGVIFSLIKAQFIIDAEQEADKLEGFFSDADQKIYMKDSSANIAVLAHEMAHAYADHGWYEFIVMMTLRGMANTIKLDEGMAALIERIIVDAWVKKQPGTGVTAPPSAYDSTFTDLAKDFMRRVSTPIAYEAYFAGQVDFTDNRRPEDTLRLGKSRRRWRWHWR
jgi:hypothetical protein